jgi:GNAT superfamily N-acetyltransferase
MTLPVGTRVRPSADGMLDIEITHLEMLARPERPRLPVPVGPTLALIRAEHPILSFYRYLYDSVGGPWLWFERRIMDDERLAAILQDAKVQLTVLYAGGVPAGFYELDGRVAGSVELAYFGLMPEFIGRRLGPFLLDRAIEAAWAQAPERVWVHTCTLDHPKALALYQRAGFVPFRRDRLRIRDPRGLGLMI